MTSCSCSSSRFWGDPGRYQVEESEAVLEARCRGRDAALGASVLGRQPMRPLLGTVRGGTNSGGRKSLAEVVPYLPLPEGSAADDDVFAGSKMDGCRIRGTTFGGAAGDGCVSRSIQILSIFMIQPAPTGEVVPGSRTVPRSSTGYPPCRILYSVPQDEQVPRNLPAALPRPGSSDCRAKVEEGYQALICLPELGKCRVGQGTWFQRGMNVLIVVRL